MASTMVAACMANGEVIPRESSAWQMLVGTPSSAKVGEVMWSPARGSWGLPIEALDGIARLESSGRVVHVDRGTISRQRTHR